MDTHSFTRALDHARRSLEAAYARLVTDDAIDRPVSPSRETLEQRVRAEAERVASLLETPPTRETAATLEEAADELDRDVAELDEVIESESDEA